MPLTVGVKVGGVPLTVGVIETEGVGVGPVEVIEGVRLVVGLTVGVPVGVAVGVGGMAVGSSFWLAMIV